MLYTVGEMAKLLGISSSTLRYYDREGLLPFVERSRGGIRMFTDADYSTLMVIGCLKKSGLSIREIREYITMAAEGDASLPKRLELFQNRRREVEKQLRELQETLSMLEYKCWYYDTAVAAGTEKAVEDMKDEEIPQPVRSYRV